MAPPKGTPKPLGSGRKRGTPNKTTAEMRAVAQSYGPEAFAILISIMRNLDAPLQVRIMAARDVLDRGYGKATETHEHSGPLGMPIPVSVDVHTQLRTVIDRLANRVAGQIGSDKIQ
jgi:hypothetical protein